MTTSFYTQIDETTYESSPLTAGPWDTGSQHAGPPSALLARAFENFEARPESRLARVHVDILRPVPVAPIRIDIEGVHRGRNLELLTGEVSAEGEVVLLARAWRMTRAPKEMPRVESDGDGLQVPEGPNFTLPDLNNDGYVSAIEWRYARGAYGEEGLVTAWLRPVARLVDGEEYSGWQRTLVVADAASGVSMPVDPTVTPAINADLSVALTREPRSDWIRLDAETSVVLRSGAYTATRISDTDGPIGQGSQALFSRVFS